MITLRHQMQDETHVIITAGPGRVIRVTPTEAKRFAWAILADLDEAEALRCGYRALVNRPAHRVVRERDANGGRGPTPQQSQALNVLRVANSTAQDIGEALSIGIKRARTLLTEMKRAGLVRKATKGGPGKPAVWEIIR